MVLPELGNTGAGAPLENQPVQTGEHPADAKQNGPSQAIEDLAQGAN